MSLPSSWLVVPSRLAAPLIRSLSRFVPSPLGESARFLTLAFSQVPDAYYFANTSYVVMLDTTYPINGTNGIPYSVVGGVEAPITINV